MATATKANTALRSPQGTESAVDRFLASMEWNGCGNYRKEGVAHWKNSLLPIRLFTPNPSFRTSFRPLTTCHAAQTHTFHLAAPMVVLTNLRIGTEHRKQDWEHHQERNHKACPNNDNERWFVALITTNYLNLQKCTTKSEDFQ